MIEYLLWHSDRAAIVEVLTRLVNPVGAFDAATGEYGPAPIATVDEETGELIASHGVLIDEIGPVVKTPPELDDEGDEISPAVIVGGHHVNMAAYGLLADVLAAGKPETGTVFERTAMLDLLGAMDWTESEAGEPPGYVGTSGVKISDPAIVTNRARVWAT